MSSPAKNIYEDDGLIIEAIENEASTCLFVFAARLPVDTRGDSLLPRLGANIFFIRAKSAAGWQTPGMAVAIQMLQERTKTASRRVALGTAMGAYGAVLFGGRLACESVVAISPDLPIDLASVSAFPPTIHLFFDNHFSEDKRQARAIAEAARAGKADAQLHPLPFSGNPSNPVLLDLNILKPLLDALLAGKPGTGWENYRAIRKTSRNMYLALMTHPKALTQHRKLLAQAASAYVKHHSQNERVALRYARLIDSLKRSDEALVILEEILARSGKPLTETVTFYAQVQKRLGNIEAAIAAYNRALEDPTADPALKKQRDQLLEPPKQPFQEAWKKKEWGFVLELAAKWDESTLPSAEDCSIIAKSGQKLKKYTIAEKWARRAVLLAEDDVTYHLSLGDIHFFNGNFFAAGQSYMRAKLIQPEGTVSNARLADVLWASVESMPGQTTIGLEMLHTSLIASRTDDLTNLQRNAALAGQFEDFATAEFLLRKAFELAPDNTTIKRLLQEAALNRQAQLARKTGGQEPIEELSFLPDVIANGILSGNDWTTVYLRQVRVFLGQKQKSNAHTFCHALFAREGANSLDALLCQAVIAYRSKLAELPRQIFGLIPQDFILKYAPVEYFCVLFIYKNPLGEKLCLEWLIHHFETIDSSSWLYCARLAAVHGETSLADKILAKLLDPAFTTGLRPDEIAEILNMREILALADRKRQTAQDKRIHLGILNYRSLDYQQTSRNIGDHIQTLSLLSNLARFGEVTYSEGSALAPFVRDLQKRIQPDRRLKIAPVEVELHEVQRDYSTCADAPDGTWLLAFGWHMHLLFKERLDFPYRPGLRPIFISFHVSNTALLTDEAIAYLRKHGPIGCRDWFTVDLLRGHDIPAFFSGCLTSTIDNLIRVSKPSGVPPAKVGVVDYELPSRSSLQVAGKMTVESSSVKTRTLVENLRAAEAQLAGYSAFDVIYTSRLHCYLPMTSIGVPIEFRPKRASDTRFEGLSGFDIQTISQLREPLLAKLEAIFRKIFSGADEAEVYRFWGELCAPDIAFADSYLKPIPDFNFPAEEHVRQILSRGVDHPATAPRKPGAPINLAFAVDANLQEQFLVALESIQAHASRPLQVWLLSRELGPAYFEQCHQVFPEIDFHFLPCDDISYGNIMGMLPNITISTMDRLFLPELLKDIPKIIYLDIDILVRCDLAEMDKIDLKGNRLAGTNSIMGRWRTGYLLLESCAIRLSREGASELRRRMHARHDMRFSGFNAGVLILNLKKMREEKFCEQFIPYASTYGMNDQEVLNFYAGSERLDLGADWNCVPWQNLTGKGKIIHWAGSSKPWNNRWQPFHDDWRKHEATVRARF